MTNTTMTRQSRFAENEELFWLWPVGARADSGRPIELTDEVILGREQGRKVRVVDDDAVSRKHAKIRWLPEQGVAIIEDLESKNGTFVNGEIVVRKYLEAQDVVRIGDQLFVVESGGGCAGADNSIPELVGGSAELERTRGDLTLAAPGELPVLLRGETGTGKEVAARAVHRLSGRTGEFVPVNCAGIPESLFESALFGHAKGAFTGATEDSAGMISEAAGGTLFLDEVGEMPAGSQAKLLRFLEDGRIRRLGEGRERFIDVRVVSATNAPLDELERSGAFRTDLLARLDGVSILLPLLKQRRWDIPMLAIHLARELGWSALSIEPDALEALMVYDWPRNVRELRQMVARWSQMKWRAQTAVNGCPNLRMKDLDHLLRKPVTKRTEAAVPPKVEAKKRPSEEELLEALTDSDWNIQQVATSLKRDRKQIYRWMERYGIERESE